jgi:orotidine-5'-phosphate decarboxylase
MIKKWGAGAIGERGYSAVGAVVAANRPGDAKRLRRIMPQNYFLMPGYGAQGGAARDVIAGFKRDGYGGLITASRSIIYAYRKPRYRKFGQKRWPDAVQSATLEMKQAINEALEHKK